MSTSCKYFKKYGFVFCYLLLSNMVVAQTAAADSLFSGFGQFRLGDPRSKFGATMIFVKGQDTGNKAHPPFFYGYSGSKPVPVDSSLVKFKGFFVGFDKDDQLSFINFVAFYGWKSADLSYRRSKKDYHKLVHYFSEKAGRPGKKMIYYNKGDMLHEGYEWTYDNILLKVDIQPNSKSRVSSIGITLERKTAPSTASR